jgi:hypothetical protein
MSWPLIGTDVYKDFVNKWAHVDGDALANEVAMQELVQHPPLIFRNGPERALEEFVLLAVVGPDNTPFVAQYNAQPEEQTTLKRQMGVVLEALGSGMPIDTSSVVATIRGGGAEYGVPVILDTITVQPHMQLSVKSATGGKKKATVYSLPYIYLKNPASTLQESASLVFSNAHTYETYGVNESGASIYGGENARVSLSGQGYFVFVLNGHSVPIAFEETLVIPDPTNNRESVCVFAGVCGQVGRTLLAAFQRRGMVYVYTNNTVSLFPSFAAFKDSKEYIQLSDGLMLAHYIIF